ncbi:MAG: Holliday junction resolvase RuvX [Ignavibacteriae bacterium]|nr:Holliday junction resolvase RuvX [Ignavibacteriota bacterium]
MEQQRVLGIDYGTVRIGLSLSDPLGITAQPYETLMNNGEFWMKLNTILDAQAVHLIVVGMPLNLKGQKAQKAQEVEVFIERLKQESRREVVVWDERFTSTIAQQTLRSMGTKKSDRQKKGIVDAMAAAVMLQSFLDSTKRSLSC